MAYLGKEYKFVKDENYDAFIKSWGRIEWWLDKCHVPQSRRTQERLVLVGTSDICLLNKTMVQGTVLPRAELVPMWMVVRRLAPEKSKVFENYRPSQKLVLNGDTYTLTKLAPEFNKVLTFKSGVEFDEKAGDYDVKTTITVDGNTVTQVQKFADGNVFTFKMEYSGDDLVMTITTAKWDGVAKRYYKA